MVILCHPRSHPLFQFHKVRLKDAEDKHRNQAAAFQFHKVRLKDSSVGEVASRLLFQFHKVRLKDEVEKQSYSTNLVSIPQGTIKSRSSTSSTNNLSAVSIPQGTIKRLQSPRNMNGYNFVSIPQGTIKRRPRGHPPALRPKFQFHKVRLKVSCA